MAVEAWSYSQSFGDKGGEEAQVSAAPADLISTVEFDSTGDYLATGDKGGRVVIFERSNEKVAPSTAAAGAKKGKDKDKEREPAPKAEYQFFAEFQSHEPEFDYLKSLEIEEKINKIRWCRRQNSAHFLLSTNDKTIKLWKVYNKKVKSIASTNLEGRRDGRPLPTLRIPAVQSMEAVVAATPRRTFSNAHAYHINSVSINSDGETYISADDLRINLWNLEISNQSFNIVDIKPTNMEELTEVITSAEFHPTSCHVFMYSSSKGTIKLSDMREGALCDRHTKNFEEEEDPSNKSFFSEIISSISDARFSRDGRYILSRDYLTLKIWDINMESKPIKTIQIHEHLRSKLCDLYENDCIFDKFECTFSGDGSHVLTGSYHNQFHVYDRTGKTDTVLEASKVQKKEAAPKKTGGLRLGRKKDSKPDAINPDAVDFTKKVLHMAWHPQENTIAVAAANNLLLFHANGM